MRVQDEPGFVLKKQNYGETSLLVDLFTRHQGRLRVVAKGARSGKLQKNRVLQPFQNLTLGWSGRSALKTLTQVEGQSTNTLNREAMACAFYLSELVWYLLKEGDPHEDLFDTYGHMLTAMALGADPEPLLRSFEFLLLQEVGYGLRLNVDRHMNPLNPQVRYIYHSNIGLTPYEEALHEYVNSAPGSVFSAMSKRDFSDPETRKFAKRFMRGILHGVLDGRELLSRKWLRPTGSPGN